MMAQWVPVNVQHLYSIRVNLGGVSFLILYQLVAKKKRHSSLLPPAAAARPRPALVGRLWRVRPTPLLLLVLIIVSEVDWAPTDMLVWWVCPGVRPPRELALPESTRTLVAQMTSLPLVLRFAPRF